MTGDRCEECGHKLSTHNELGYCTVARWRVVDGRRVLDECACPSALGVGAVAPEATVSTDG